MVAAAVTGAVCLLIGYVAGRWVGVQTGYARAALQILDRIGK